MTPQQHNPEIKEPQQQNPSYPNTSYDDALDVAGLGDVEDFLNSSVSDIVLNTTGCVRQSESPYARKLTLSFGQLYDVALNVKSDIVHYVAFAMIGEHSDIAAFQIPTDRSKVQFPILAFVLLGTECLVTCSCCFSARYRIRERTLDMMWDPRTLCSLNELQIANEGVALTSVLTSLTKPSSSTRKV